jgi:hypothetical protein
MHSVHLPAAFWLEERIEIYHRRSELQVHPLLCNDRETSRYTTGITE